MFTKNLLYQVQFVQLLPVRNILIVWFVKIKSKEETSDETVIDEYGNKIILSQNYFIAIYLPKVLSKKQRQSDKELAK